MISRLQQTLNPTLSTTGHSPVGTARPAQRQKKVPEAAHAMRFGAATKPSFMQRLGWGWDALKTQFTSPQFWQHAAIFFGACLVLAPILNVALIPTAAIWLAFNTVIPFMQGVIQGPQR